MRASLSQEDTSPKLIANSFTTSKLGKNSSSRRNRHVSMDVKWMLCCCSPFGLVHLSLVFLPRDSSRIASTGLFHKSDGVMVVG